MGHGEATERAGALGVGTPLDDVLAVEVGQRLDQVHIVQDEGAVGADGEGVGVAVGDGTSGGL